MKNRNKEMNRKYKFKKGYFKVRKSVSIIKM